MEAIRPRTRISRNSLKPLVWNMTSSMHRRRTRKNPDSGSRTRSPIDCTGLAIQMAALETSRRKGFEPPRPPPTYRLPMAASCPLRIAASKEGKTSGGCWPSPSMAPTMVASVCRHPCRMAPESPRSPRRSSRRTRGSSPTIAETTSSVPSRLSSSTTITSQAMSTESRTLLTLRSRGPRFAASFNAGMTSTSFSPAGTGLARLSARLYDVTVAADEILSNFTSIPGRAWRRFHDSLFILLLTAAGFAAMGYHPGFEDDGIYLSAVKSDLNPALYPHDADFVRLQVQATAFDEFIAGFVRLTHIPVDWSGLLWQFLSLYAILWSARRIAQRLFPERRAQWAGVALLAAMFTLPVAGTALNLADQHLHPRTMATAFILSAIDFTLARRFWHSNLLLLLAFVFHPIMAAAGISCCLFIALVLTDSVYVRLTTHARPRAIVAAFPIAWIFEAPTPAWRRALHTRTYYFLYQWTWYEWLGAIGPLVIFWIVWRYAVARRQPMLARFSLAVLLYGIFHLALAMVLLAPSALIRITPLQPMRYLHLVYMFLVLIGGCLLGRHVLRGSAWRWALVLVAAYGGMFLSQRLLLPASANLELPGPASANPWLQAFAWIRQNTPPDAYFALDPNYLAAPGEDYHSFRALAERSQLADAIKDAAVVTQVPELASRWEEQVDAQAGWSSFQAPDFERLKARFGVAWALVPYPAPARLTCIWHNDRLSVCRIPGPAPLSLDLQQRKRFLSLGAGRARRYDN